MKKILSCLLLLLPLLAAAKGQPASVSVYTLRPEDPEAIYFTPEN